MKPFSRPAQLVFGIAATIILSALSLTVVGGEGNPFRSGFSARSSCTTPGLSGTIVNVALTNMGGPMMGQGGGRPFGGARRLSTDHATVAHGTVSVSGDQRWKHKPRTGHPPATQFPDSGHPAHRGRRPQASR